MRKEVDKFLKCVNEARDRDTPTEEVSALKACKIEMDNVKWSASSVPMFDSALLSQFTDREKYDVDLELMSPEEFLDKQIEMVRKRQKQSPEGIQSSPRELFYSGVRENHLNDIKESMKEGKVFPMMFLEYNEEGELADFQEGRHRGVALKERGVDKIPVWRARKCKKRGCSSWKNSNDGKKE